MELRGTYAAPAPRLQMHGKLDSVSWFGLISGR